MQSVMNALAVSEAVRKMFGQLSFSKIGLSIGIGKKILSHSNCFFCDALFTAHVQLRFEWDIFISFCSLQMLAF